VIQVWKTEVMVLSLVEVEVELLEKLGREEHQLSLVQLVWQVIPDHWELLQEDSMVAAVAALILMVEIL
jgi:hypothetical protein